ncbi:MAG: UPF0149 family protein [Pseudomonadota bacterium]|nr:UPF0149 family protein [Pseudomonadota bacterium]
MVFRIELPQNTESELLAFEGTCERLAGFDIELEPERVEGLLTSLAALPQVPPTERWLTALFAETFDRVFADPADHAQALLSLQRRLRVLCAQLDPEALFEDPDVLRLQPMVDEWSDADRQHLVEVQGWPATEAAAMATGAVWAEGFLRGMRSLPELWAVPGDEAALALFEQSLQQISALMLEPEGEALKSHVDSVYAGGPAPDREQLFVEACLSVQDLRLYWVDFAPRGSTRRVEPTPGRNDPCPCGSGKKFKKCHGAG